MNMTLRSKDLSIEIDVSKIETLYSRLIFDKRRMQQVLVNLLSNATKFQTEGVIKVTARVQKQQ